MTFLAQAVAVAAMAVVAHRLIDYTVDRWWS